MKRKSIVIFSLLILNIIMGLSASPETQALTYECKLQENESYIWEVSELNVNEFKEVFGYETNYEEGDQMKIKILNVLEVSYGWSLTVEEWGYKSSFSKNGTITYYSVYSDPSNYAGNIFLPTPVSEYLLDAQKTLPSRYIISGLNVTKRESNYTMIKEYTDKGILGCESYLDEDGTVLVKSEGIFLRHDEEQSETSISGYEPMLLICALVSAAAAVYFFKKRQLLFN